MDVAESKGTPILDELRRTNRLEKYILALSWEENGQLVGKFVNFSTLGYNEEIGRASCRERV